MYAIEYRLYHHTIMIGNKAVERVEQFRHLGTNSTHEVVETEVRE
jgi:hypothetical protein